MPDGNGKLGISGLAKGERTTPRSATGPGAGPRSGQVLAGTERSQTTLLRNWLPEGALTAFVAATTTSAELKSDPIGGCFHGRNFRATPRAVPHPGLLLPTSRRPMRASISAQVRPMFESRRRRAQVGRIGAFLVREGAPSPSTTRVTVPRNIDPPRSQTSPIERHDGCIAPAHLPQPNRAASVPAARRLHGPLNGESRSSASSAEVWKRDRIKRTVFPSASGHRRHSMRSDRQRRRTGPESHRRSAETFQTGSGSRIRAAINRGNHPTLPIPETLPAETLRRGAKGGVKASVKRR